MKNLFCFYTFFNLICVNFFVLELYIASCHGQEIDFDAVQPSPDEIKDITNIINQDDINVVKDKIKDSPKIREWKKECEKTVGSKMWRVIRRYQQRIQNCISKYIVIEDLEKEVNERKERGELDLVFKKYCGLRDVILGCVDEELELIKPCLTDQQIIDLNFTRNAVDAGIDFICYENGDRIALFMAEDGQECLTNSTETIRSCVKSKIPEVQKAEDDLQSLRMDQFLINDENCKKIAIGHQCVVEATTSCDDPTPSNILDSLITQALKVTPCSHTTTFALNASHRFTQHLSALFPHFLTLMWAGLTAAHILL